MLIGSGLSSQLSPGIALHFLNLILFVDFVYEAANVDRVLECTRFGVGAASRSIEAPLPVKVFISRESRRCVQTSSCKVCLGFAVVVVLDLASFL